MNLFSFNGRRIKPRSTSLDRFRRIGSVLLSVIFTSAILLQIIPPFPALAVMSYSIENIKGGQYPEDFGSLYPVGNIPGEFEDSRFVIANDPEAKDGYIAFCADYHLRPPDPNDPDRHTRIGSGVRNHEASALAVALAHPGYGAQLTNTEFNLLFPAAADIDDRERLLYMSCFVWASEDISGASPTNPAAWGSELISLRSKLASLGGGFNNYIIIAQGIERMADLSESGSPAFEVEYDAGSGRLTVSRDNDAYLTNAVYGVAGVGTKYDFTLTVTGSGVSVIKNDVIQTSFPVLIRPEDHIYIYSSGDDSASGITITVKDQDSVLTLVSESIRGDLLKNEDAVGRDYEYQDIITGTAMFGISTAVISSAVIPPQEVVSIPVIKQVIGADASEDEMFTFTIRETTPAGAVAAGGFSGVITASHNCGAVDFEVKVIEEDKWQYYSITETSIANWTAVGGNVRHVRVKSSGGTDTVEYFVGGDRGDDSNWDDDSGSGDVLKTFINNYTPASRPAEIRIDKTVTGNWRGGFRTFDYTIQEVDEDGDAIDPPIGKSITVYSAETGTAATGYTTHLVSRTPGVYYFEIAETGSGDSNWLHDDTVFIATVAIPVSGAVSVTYNIKDVAENQSEARFHNFYRKADVKLGYFTKNTAGLYLGGIGYTFSLYEVDGDGENPVLIQKRTDITSGNFYFNVIPGLEIGEHYFMIVEEDKVNPDFEYDDGKLYAKITVSLVDEGKPDGALTYAVEYPYTGIGEAKDNIIFINTYTLADIDFEFNKIAYGDNGTFNFAIRQVNIADLAESIDHADSHITSAAGPSIATAYGAGVSTVNLRRMPDGEYYYEIREQDGGADGWEYDTDPQYVKVVVDISSSTPVRVYRLGDDHEAVADEDNEVSVKDFSNNKFGFAAEFVNVYNRASVSIGFEKTVLGRSVSTPFNFKITASNSAGEYLPADPHTQEKSVSARAGSSGSDSFTVTGLPVGDYWYVIEEIIPFPEPEAWIYDKTKHIVKVEVRECTEGKGVAAEVIYPDGFTKASFTNRYTKTDVNLSFTKDISGSTSSRTFTFNVEEVEKAGDAWEAVPYDDSNKYHPETVTSTGTISRSVPLTLSAVEGPARTLYYRITEEIPAPVPAGWTYDEAPLYYKVDITVENGVVVAVSSVFKPSDGAPAGAKTTNTFTNRYYSGSATLRFAKTFAGTGYPVKTFYYDYRRADVLPEDFNCAAPPTHEDIVYPADAVLGTSSTLSGLRSFPVSGLTPGTYFFRINERPNSTSVPVWDGWTHAANSIYARVTVTSSTESAAGTTTINWWNGSDWVSDATLTAPYPEHRTFDNMYTFTTKGSGVITLGGMKTVPPGGEYAPDSPVFRFTLTQVTNATGDVPYPGGITQTAATGITGGIFTFPQIRLTTGYTTPGDGDNPYGFAYRDYYFRIEETDGFGEKMTGGSGWTYDRTTYILTVRVWAYPSVVEVVQIDTVTEGGRTTEQYGSGTGHDPAPSYTPVKQFAHSDLEFTNTFEYKHGELTVKKEFPPDSYHTDWGKDNNTVFTARVKDAASGRYLTFSGTAPYYEYTGTSVNGSTIRFSVSQDAVLSKLPAGREYVVEEDPVEHCIASYSYLGVLTETGAEVTVTNTFEPGTNALIIKKEIDGYPEDWGVNENTVFRARLLHLVNGIPKGYVLFPKGNQNNIYHAVGSSDSNDPLSGGIIAFTEARPVTITGLSMEAKDTYQVIELDGNHYTTKYRIDSGSITDGCEVNLPENANMTVTVINTYEKNDGALVVSKKLSGSYADWGIGNLSVFNFRVKCVETGDYLTFENNIYTGSSATGTYVAFSQSSSAVLTGIPHGGFYTVEEAADPHLAEGSPGYEYPGGENNIGNVGLAEVTNTYKPGTHALIIDKRLTGSHYTWGVNNQTVFTALVMDVTNDYFLKFPGGKINNVYQAGGNSGSDIPPFTDSDYIIEFTAGQPVTLLGLVPDMEYRIVEFDGVRGAEVPQDETEGWHYSVTYAGNNVVLPKDTNTTVTLANFYYHSAGLLVISKELEGSPHDWGVDGSTVFGARIKCLNTGKYMLLTETDGQYFHTDFDDRGTLIKFSQGFAAVVRDIPAGEYEIEESGGRYQTRYVYNANVNAVSFTEDDNHEARHEVRVINTYESGEGAVIVEKRLAGYPRHWGANNATVFGAFVRDADNKSFLRFGARVSNTYSLIGDNGVDIRPDQPGGLPLGHTLAEYTIGFTAAQAITLTNLPEGRFEIFEIAGSGYAAAIDGYDAGETFVSLTESQPTRTVTITNTFREQPPDTPPVTPPTNYPEPPEEPDPGPEPPEPPDPEPGPGPSDPEEPDPIEPDPPVFPENPAVVLPPGTTPGDFPGIDFEATQPDPDRPGGTNPNAPPMPNSPGYTIMPFIDEDGEIYFIEFDDEGVPLGEWRWDDDEEMWIFDDDIPLGEWDYIEWDFMNPNEDEPLIENMPVTGGISWQFYSVLFGLILAGLGVFLRKEKKAAV
jgi:hypothetical protein